MRKFFLFIAMCVFMVSAQAVDVTKFAPRSSGATPVRTQFVKVDKSKMNVQPTTTMTQRAAVKKAGQEALTTALDFESVEIDWYPSYSSEGWYDYTIYLYTYDGSGWLPYVFFDIYTTEGLVFDGTYSVSDGNLDLSYGSELNIPDGSGGSLSMTVTDATCTITEGKDNMTFAGTLTTADGDFTFSLTLAYADVAYFDAEHPYEPLNEQTVEFTVTSATVDMSDALSGLMSVEFATDEGVTINLCYYHTTTDATELPNGTFSFTDGDADSFIRGTYYTGRPTYSYVLIDDGKDQTPFYIYDGTVTVSGEGNDNKKFVVDVESFYGTKFKFTYPEEKPLTVAQAIEIGTPLAHNTSTSESYTVEGYIVKWENTSNGTNQSFYMHDTKGFKGTCQFEAYKALTAESLPIGTKVALSGPIMKYNSMIEISDGTVEVLEKAVPEELTFAEVKSAIEALEDIKDAKYNKSNWDKYVTFEAYTTTNMSASDGKQTAWLAAELGGTGEIQAYRLKVASQIAQDVKVKVTGTIAKFYKAGSDECTYEIVEGKMEVVTEEEDPEVITVAEAMAIGTTLAKGEKTTKKYTVEGYYTQLYAPYSYQYGNESAFVGDNDYYTEIKADSYLLAYQCYSDAPVSPGSKVQVTGFIEHYVNKEETEEHIQIKQGTTAVLTASKPEEVSYEDAAAYAFFPTDPAEGKVAYTDKYVTFTAITTTENDVEEYDLQTAELKDPTGEYPVSIRAFKLKVASKIGKDVKVRVTGVPCEYLEKGKTKTIAEIVNGTMEVIEDVTPKHTITVKVLEGFEELGSVNINGGGTTGEFEEGETITLNAIANTGYEFVQWSDGSQDASHEIEVGTKDATYFATFQPVGAPKHTITVEVAEGQSAMGTVDINGSGTSGSFAEGAGITLHAYAYPGYEFVAWSDGSKDAAHIVTVGTEDATYTATFQEQAVAAHTITVAVAAGQDGWGVVDINGLSIKSGDFEEGETVTLYAIPVEGYEFVEWSDGSTDEMHPIVVGTTDATYIATFKEKEIVKHTITVEVAAGQSSWGAVDINSIGTTGDFEEGETITLHAVANEGYEFVEWNDGNTNATREIEVGKVDATYTATFKEKEIVKHTITVEVESGQESMGTVDIDGWGYSGDFAEGEILTLTASPSDPTQYVFDKWNDGNEDNPRTIVVGDKDETYVASFIAGAAFTVEVKVADGQDTWGTVSLPGGITSASYKENAEIEIVAEPADGYKFVKWSDGTDDFTDATLKITVTADITYTAYFEELPKVEIEVAVADGQEDRGTVSLPGGKTKDEFAIGASVVLTASPKSGFAFEKWDDDATAPAVRTITVTEAKKFIASFVESSTPVQTLPIAIAGQELSSEKLTLIAGVDLPGVLVNGVITFDPQTGTLTLSNVELKVTDASVAAILLNAGVDLSKLNIIIEGTCKIEAAGTAVELNDATSITLSGDGSLAITAANGILLNKTNLTLEGLALAITASNKGIAGTGVETLVVKGGKFEVAGALGSVVSLKDMQLQYCDFQTGYDFLNNQVEKDGSAATDKVILDVWPMLTVSPVEKGSAKFILTSKKDPEAEFIDKGWFQEGDVVTIEVEATDGFVFGHWTDDTDWKDAKKRKGETRKLDKDDTNQTLQVLMYFEAESDADWFGVNNDEFVRFSFGDNAEKVARATNSLSDVKAGDFVEDEWVFIEGSVINKFPFDGTLNDGKDILGKDDKIEKYNKKTLSDATDMAYDLIDATLYAVAGSKLYRINTTENKEIATFKLNNVETTIVSIAVDADGMMYALGLGDGVEGALYTVDIDDKDANLKPVGKKENAGKIGMKVNNEPQSIAFDLTSGELFWGAPDYVRVIDLAKMKTHIAGDLGQKEGAQGYIKSLHRMNEMVEVTVEVDKDQATWGTASVGDVSTSAKNRTASAYFVEGAPVTITATANDGYHFVEWVNADNKRDTHDDATYEFAAEEITYIAVFEEGSEGIQSITIDPTKNVQKVLIDGTIYIFRDGRVYTVTGERME